MIRSTLRPQRAVIKRSALVLALGACLASGSVFAQKATGDIFGHAGAGQSITIESSDTGLKREITADKDGGYRFSQLPTGNYKITSGGQTRDVVVRVGTGSEVSFAKAGGETLETITVQGNAINPIDVSSVESSTVFSAEQIAALPVARDVTNVALLAPGTVKGDAGFGNLASFGGASVAENGYYINGFDVTNIRNFTSFANLPFDAIGEQQVKTGGYGAEFGRSLGGVINIVTKRGTNEWKMGGALYYEPESLRQHSPDVLSRTEDSADGRYYRFTSHNEADSLSYNAYAGGALIKDRLFIFALAEGQKDDSDTFGDTTGARSNKYRNHKPHGMVKLDFNISDNHILEFTAISNRDYTHHTVYDNDTEYSTSHDVVLDPHVDRSGGEVYIAKYTGYLTDNFTVAVQGGQLKALNGDRVGLEPGADCPRVYDGRSGGLIPLGCWVTDTVRDPTAPAQRDRRRAGRIDFDWRLGDHNLRFGYDAEKFDSTNTGTAYSGGAYWRYFVAPASGRVNGAQLPTGTTQYVRKWIRTTQSGKYDVQNEAAYLEDSWQINNNLLAYLGLRAENFDNKNGDGVSFAKSDALIAPRLGFAWDVNGDGTFKVFGNAGRYYIPIASNSNIRASAAELFTQQFYTFASIDPATGAPVGLGPQLGPTVVSSPGLAPNPQSITANNLKPMYQDEVIMGLQHAFSDNWSGGVRGVWRKVKNGMDDFCDNTAFGRWAAATGHDDFDQDSVPDCVIVNPGKDLTIALDLNNDGNLTKTTIPASFIGLPKYDRRYTALEFFWEKVWDGKWYLQGSYTLSHSYGNAEGYVNSTLEQDDAGLTQDFDYASFEDGATGNLPNDRRHSFKLFGMYQVAQDWRVSSNLLIQSGRPLNCNGFVPEDARDYDAANGGSGSYTSASSFYCNEGYDAEGKPIQILHNRGSYGRTPWITQLDLGLAWTPKLGDGNLTLKMDVFNVFNFHRAVDFNELGDRNRAAPEKNENFLLPATFQQPRYFRFTARYDFSL